MGQTSVCKYRHGLDRAWGDEVKMKKVIRIEMRELVYERVMKSKRTYYVKGGYRIEERIYRDTTVLPHAILECGHERRQYSGDKDIRAAKRLGCYECDKEERLAQMQEKEVLK
jgi:hypothetical protein